MRQIDVINGDIISPESGVSTEVAHYDGNYVTCYPGSNQKDDGKLQLEFNMSRFVTRVSSKNFCIVKPSFELSLVTNQTTGAPQIEVGIGQASINGMDLIMTTNIYINPPSETGDFYIALKLARDSSSNVLGDLIVGVMTTFQGVYIGYWDEKPDPMDPDMLYLGKVNWDGTAFSNLEEDEDKYGRLWAEDVLGKFLDPKHPDTRRLNLQELIYNLPDWYFSKEGDTVYGPVTIADSRDSGNNGILFNVDENGSYITIKEPGTDNDKLQFYGDVDRSGVIDQTDYDLIESYINGEEEFTDLQIALSDVNHDGVVDEKDLKYIKNYLDYQDYLDNLKPGEKAKTPLEMDLNFGDLGTVYYIDNTTNQINIISLNGKNGLEISKAELYTDSNSYDLGSNFHIHNDGGICIDAEGPVTVEGDGNITLSTELGSSPVLDINNDNIKITDPDDTSMSYTFDIIKDGTSGTANFTLGSAIWQYTYDGSKASTGRVSLLQNNVAYLDVKPNSEFRQFVRVQNGVYVGQESTYGAEKTYLKPQELRVSRTSDTSIYTSVTPTTVNIYGNGDGSNSSIASMQVSGTRCFTKILDNGSINLSNTSGNRQPLIYFADASNSVTLQKIVGVAGLNISGQLTTNGDITSNSMIIANSWLRTGAGLSFSTTTNSPSLTASGTTLVTSGGLNVGASGNQPLRAGTTTLGNTTINGTLTGTGNWVTNGTIQGSKVFNAVYMDYAEVFRKSKDEEIEPGYAVYVGQDGLVHKVNSSDVINYVIGIVSDTAGVLLGGKDIPEDERVEVGLVGQIWAKTNDEFLMPGMMVKVNADGTVSKTNNRAERFGITLTGIENGKVRIVFNG